MSAPISQEGYVLMQLREHDKLFLDLGIADYVSPEFNPIPDTDSFLLVLSADRDYFKFWPLVISLCKTAILLVTVRLLYVILSSYSEKILELWNTMITILF